MTDIREIEKRTVYRIPDDFMVHAPYVRSEPWTEGTVTVDGDMMPVEQQAIPWCTFHDRPLGTGAGGGDFNPLDEACAVPPTTKDTLGLYDCVISTGGPSHKWWVDL